MSSEQWRPMRGFPGTANYEISNYGSRELVWLENPLGRKGFKLATIGKGKRPRDPNHLAKWIVDRSANEVEDPEAVTATPPSELSAYMAAIGRKGGQIGEKRRLKTRARLHDGT